MKKSELRKIIRESINGLMNEQGTNTCMAAYVDHCDGSTAGTFPCPTLPNGQFLTQANVGDIFNKPNGPLPNEDYVITQVVPYPSWSNPTPMSQIVINPNGCSTPSSGCLGATTDHCDGTPGGHFPCPQFPGGQFLVPSDVGKVFTRPNGPLPNQEYKITSVGPTNTSTPGSQIVEVPNGCSTPSGGCPGWANYSNWISSWSNLGPFNSPNPNQPCNFICNKIIQWTNAITNAGPVQAIQLQCKLDEAINQSQIHGCVCKA